MFWVVRDERGIMLFYGSRPEKINGLYVSHEPPLAHLPEGSVEVGDTPIHMKLIPAD